MRSGEVRIVVTNDNGTTAGAFSSFTYDVVSVDPGHGLSHTGVRPFNDPVAGTVDHVVPLKQGTRGWAYPTLDGTAWIYVFDQAEPVNFADCETE